MKTAEEILNGFIIKPGIIGYDVIDKAMKEYASQFIDASAKSIHPYENGEKRKVMCNSILKLKDQLK